jgi:glutamine cyclotransferase
VARYPHDPGAFTEGLIYDNGVLYEGTGIIGQSSLRRVELKTGRVEQIVQLPPPFFGEGVAVLGDRVFQLTWRSNVGFVYDKATFQSMRRFNYDTEGWGLTTDGKSLIMSDGTRTLYYLDPNTLQVTGKVQVKGGPATIADMRLNELEYVKGEVYANVWPTDFIVRIDPESGEVVGWANLAGILSSDESKGVDALNGIAYDFVDDKLFVTGKYWPTMFEIKLVPKN